MSGLQFRPELVRLIQRGAKTMTRRPVKAARVNRDGAVVGGQIKREVDQVVAVQPGRGKTAECHVRITEVRREKLGDITERDARREGFATREQFLAYWRDLHDAGIRPALRDLLERLAVIEALDIELDPTALHPGLGQRALKLRLAELQRLALAHHNHLGWTVTDQGADVIDTAEGDLGFAGALDQEVYVIGFRLELNGTRFLVPAARPAGNDDDRRKRPDLDGDDPTDHGYVTGRDDLDAGAVVDPTTLDPRWKARAERKFTKAAGTNLEQQLARALRAADAAEAAGLDVTNHKRAIAERIDRLERATQQRSAAA